MKNSKEIAAELMKAIMYDNGMVNILYAEQYSLEYVKRIAECVELAISLNPNLEFDEEVIETMACGEYSQMQALIDHYESFSQLSEVLNDYFENIEFTRI